MWREKEEKAESGGKFMGRKQLNVDERCSVNVTHKPNKEHSMREIERAQLFRLSHD